MVSLSFSDNTTEGGFQKYHLKASVSALSVSMPRTSTVPYTYTKDYPITFACGFSHMSALTKLIHLVFILAIYFSPQ